MVQRRSQKSRAGLGKPSEAGEVVRGPGVPSFRAATELARWVAPEHVRDGGRVLSAAFQPNPDEAYLSVDSLEVSPIGDIAKSYRLGFQPGRAPVAVVCRKVAEYVSASRDAGVGVIFDARLNTWEFAVAGNRVPAFRHRPTRGSRAHCGVETISCMDELGMRKFARRLGGVRPHLVEVS
jgi:hypothetical protein